MAFERLLVSCISLLLVGAAVRAQSNFDYTPVRQFHALLSEGEQLYAYTMNDMGEVAVIGRSQTGMTIYFNDGTDNFESWEVVYSGAGPLSTRIGMNNERWISVQGWHDFGSGAQPGALFFRPGFDQTAGEQPLFRPLVFSVGNSQSTHRINDDENIALYEFDSSVASWGTIGATDAEKSSTLPARWNDSPADGPHGGPTINDAGQVAEVGHRQIDGEEYLVLADWDPDHCPGTLLIPDKRLEFTPIGRWFGATPDERWASPFATPGLNAVGAQLRPTFVPGSCPQDPEEAQEQCSVCNVDSCDPACRPHCCVRRGYAAILTGNAAPGEFVPGPFSDVPFRAVLLDPIRQDAIVLAEQTPPSEVYAFRADVRPALEPWLTEKNQLLFAVAEDSVGRHSLWLTDVRISDDGENRPPYAVYTTGDTLPVQGGVPGTFFPPQVGPQGWRQSSSQPPILNAQGKILFAVGWQSQGAGAPDVGLFLAEPAVDGIIPSQPVEPDEALPFGFRFTGCGCRSVSDGCGGGGIGTCACFRERNFFPPGSTVPAEPVCYVDPPVAVGYTFASDPGSLNFATVSIPAPLPGGDAEFGVAVGNFTYPLLAGTVFDFAAAGFPSGVATFSIVGIDADEGLDPADPLAFVSGLTWHGPSDGDVSFTMTPIEEDTDDDDGDGVPNGQDNCPGTVNPSQADSDNNGIGDACDTAATPGEAGDLLVLDYDSVTGNLAITFTPACEASNHDIYYGPLDQVSSLSWSGSDCDIGKQGQVGDFSPGPGSYFFVVAGNAAVEGGPLGFDSQGEPRPAFVACGRVSQPPSSACE